MDNYLFDEGRISKMEVDYAPTCDEKIPKAIALAKSDSDEFHQAIEMLLQLEKQTRLGADMASCSRVLVAICQICFNAGNWNALNEYIILLARRRSQLKQAVSKMIQECCTYVDKVPNKAIKLKLINTLRTVTEGKIYVEVERARLTRILARMKESEGDIVGAAAVMEELQVETYGSMDKREKVELILEQMRLCLLKEDYVSTQIIAKKINTKFFEDPRHQDLKFIFYDLMIHLDRDISFLKTSRYYQAIADSKPVPLESLEDNLSSVTNVSSEKTEKLESDTLGQPTEEQTQDQRQKMKCAILYCILASFDNEQNDMMEHLSKNKKLDEIPSYKEILRLFMSEELINFESFTTEFGSILSENEMFQDTTPHGKKCSSALKDRLIEHNIRIISNYYSRIYLKRMSELLILSSEKCEEYLSKLANTDTIRVKIDRPAEIVYFTVKKTSSDILNNWAHDTNRLMTLVNKTCHFINKEECINSVLGLGLEE